MDETMMDKPWSEKVYDAIRKTTTDSKDAYEKFWVYEQDVNRKLKTDEERIKKLEEEKAQLVKQLKECDERLTTLSHEDLRNLYKQAQDSLKIAGENVGRHFGEKARAELEVKRLEKEVKSLKASQPTTTESEWKLRLAEMNALREAEQETRLAAESELEGIKKALGRCKEQMLILAGVMGKV